VSAGTAAPGVALPRVRLRALDTTPLVPAPALSRRLGADVWLKRDDLLGLGLGGNKIRSLELLLGDAEAGGCDTLLTGAGPQSNWALLAALAARVRGLDPHVVFYGRPVEPSGNLLLHDVVGTTLRWTGDPDRSSVDRMLPVVAAELAAGGRRPYVLPRGGATPRGAVGYLAAVEEIDAQLPAGTGPVSVWLPTGSCSTQAGLVGGVTAGGLPWEVVGVTVSRPGAECRDRVRALAEGACALVGRPAAIDEPRVLEGWIGAGYGRPTPEGAAAARLVAREEGVLLDPVFGAKAMAALLAAGAAGALGGTVVFLVTGGAATLFAGGGAKL
jgi:D-cysteine desulfhydrase